MFDPDNHYTLKYTSRGVILADIEIPSDHVLVGLQFASIYVDDSTTMLGLKALSQPFNFTSGIIDYQVDSSSHLVQPPE